LQLPSHPTVPLFEQLLMVWDNIVVPHDSKLVVPRSYTTCGLRNNTLQTSSATSIIFNRIVATLVWRFLSLRTVQGPQPGLDTIGIKAHSKALHSAAWMKSQFRFPNMSMSSLRGLAAVPLVNPVHAKPQRLPPEFV